MKRQKRASNAKEIQTHICMLQVVGCGHVVSCDVGWLWHQFPATLSVNLYKRSQTSTFS